MLLCSVRIKKTAVTVLSLCMVAVFVLICFVSLKLSPSDTMTIGEETYSLHVEDEDDIREFLSACEHETDQLILKREIIIPTQWDERYEAYEKLQVSQGFSLERFRGEEATEYIFSLQEDGLFAEALVSKSMIIAAHISPMDGSEDIEPLIQNSTS